LRRLHRRHRKVSIPAAASRRPIIAQALAAALITMTFDRYGHLFDTAADDQAQMLGAVYVGGKVPGSGHLLVGGDCHDGSGSPDARIGYRE
jgi:hypothetical protein